MYLLWLLGLGKHSKSSCCHVEFEVLIAGTVACAGVGYSRCRAVRSRDLLHRLLCTWACARGSQIRRPHHTLPDTVLVPRLRSSGRRTHYSPQGERSIVSIPCIQKLSEGAKYTSLRHCMRPLCPSPCSLLSPATLGRTLFSGSWGSCPFTATSHIIFVASQSWYRSLLPAAHTSRPSFSLSG